MAVTVGLFGESGQGKSTSVVVNQDGKYNPNEYQGMDPECTIIINSDKKYLPFGGEWIKGKNVFWEDDVETIKKILLAASKSDKIRSIYIDTINGIMLAKEMRDIRRGGYDKWTDLAQQIFDLIYFCNDEVAENKIVYLSGHVGMYTDSDGNESKGLLTNGRKLEKIKIETKLPIVLFSKVVTTAEGNREYKFETQANRSSAKSPIGMFDEVLIPNSLKFVDEQIRKYYNLQ